MGGGGSCLRLGVAVIMACCLLCLFGVLVCVVICLLC